MIFALLVIWVFCSREGRCLFIFVHLQVHSFLVFNSDFLKALNTFCGFVTNLTWTDVRISMIFFFFIIVGYASWCVCYRNSHLLNYWMLHQTPWGGGGLCSACYTYHMNFLKCKEFLNSETPKAPRALV